MKITDPVIQSSKETNKISQNGHKRYESFFGIDDESEVESIMESHSQRQSSNSQGLVMSYPSKFSNGKRKPLIS